MIKRVYSRGLSTIVATLLIIMLTLVAVGIIWVVVRNVIQGSSEQVSLGKFTLNLEILQFQKINDSALNVIVKRNSGDGEFVGISFVVYDGDSTEVIKTNNSLKELETRNFELHLLIINVSKVQKISIVPIFRLESGKEVNGDVEDEYLISSASQGILTCTPYCPTGAQCGSDGCGGVCGNCSGSTPNCINYQCSEQVCTPSCLNKQCGSDGCSESCGVCSLVNAVSSCNATFKCVISSCSSGYANCDLNETNGCETQLGTTSNCASCGNACLLGQTCNSSRICVSPTETCSDGVQNQGETEIDCGGPCPACSTYLRTFYVSNSGNDNNSGTSESSSWRTIAKVNSQTFLPGDAILFKRGDEWRETLIPASNGASSAYITFSAYGSSGNIPIINGADIVTGWVNEGGNVWSVNAPTFENYGFGYDYMVIVSDNMFTQVGTLAEVTSFGKFFIDKTPTPDKVYIYSTNNPASTVEVSARMFGAGVMDKTYIKFENIDFRNTAHTGLYFYATTGAGQVIGNSLVSHCNFYRNRNVGVMFDNGYSNNLVEDCTSTYNGNGYYSWSDRTYGSDDNTFRNCYADHNINYIVGTFTDGHGFGIYNSDDNIVEYSESSYNYCGIATDTNGNANDVILRYNYIHDITNGAPGIGFGSNMPAGTVHQAYYNIIVNTGDLDVFSYPIAVGSTTNASKVYIYNNVIYQDGGLNHGKIGMYFRTPNGVTLKNNIFYIKGTGYIYGIIYSGAGTFNEIDNNIYYFPDASATRWSANGSLYPTLSSWRGVVSDEENSMTSNALLTNPSVFDFSLQSGSPAINAGANVDLTRDYNGNLIVGLPDIGAFEYQ